MSNPTPIGRSPGPVPTPTERKRRLGNPGHQKLPDAIPAVPAAVQVGAELPEPFGPLGQRGRLLWDRTLKFAAVWLSESDLTALQRTCELEDEYVILRAKVMTAEEPHWRDRVALRQLERTMLAFWASLGLTPADRARLGLAEVRLADATHNLIDRASGSDRKMTFDFIDVDGGDEETG